MKQKLLLILPDLRDGGAERSLVNLLQSMDYDRFSVDLLLFEPGGMFLPQVPPQVRISMDQQALHALYQPAPACQLSPSRCLYYAAMCRLATGFSKRRAGRGERSDQFRWRAFYRRMIPPLQARYDVAVAYRRGDPLYYLTEKVNAARKIAWLHDAYGNTGLDAALDLPHYRQVDQVVATCEAGARAWREAFPTETDKITVLPNLISAKSVRAMAQAGAAPELDAAQPNLVSVGKLHPNKGYDLAIEAARVLVARGVAFQWYILGTGDLHAALQAHAQRAGVAGRVHFLGARHNPYPYMQAADVVVQPSRLEGHSFVLEEAKILARPILATAYPTAGDQLSALEGLTVPIAPEALADGIQHMLSHGRHYSDYLRTQPYGNTADAAEHMALLGARSAAAAGGQRGSFLGDRQCAACECLSRG